MALTVHEFRATSEAQHLGLTVDERLAAVQWDGTVDTAEATIDWVQSTGGGASQIDGAIVVVGAGDVQFASAGSWVAVTDAGHLVLGPSAIGRVCTPQRPADELAVGESVPARRYR